jgi:hypothetical protein
VPADLQIQIVPVAICLLISRAHVISCSSSKVKISVLIKQSYRSPPSIIMFSIEPRMLSIFSADSPISVKQVVLVPVPRSTPNFIPPKYRCQDYCCVWFRHIYLAPSKNPSYPGELTLISTWY